MYPRSMIASLRRQYDRYHAEPMAIDSAAFLKSIEGDHFTARRYPGMVKRTAEDK